MSTICLLHRLPFTALRHHPSHGGSRGSEFINEEIIKIVPELTQKLKLFTSLRSHGPNSPVRVKGSTIGEKGISSLLE